MLYCVVHCHAPYKKLRCLLQKYCGFIFKANNFLYTLCWCLAWPVQHSAFGLGLQKQKQPVCRRLKSSYVPGALRSCCCIVSGNSVTVQNLLGSDSYFSPCPQTTKDDLLLTDFEGALKFFRVQLPKRYRSEENAKKLMELACNMKVKMW